MVTVLDRGRPVSRRRHHRRGSREHRHRLSAREGYLDGRSLAEVFAWLRPTDLVWRYWVNNYVGASRLRRSTCMERRHHKDGRALHRDMVTWCAIRLPHRCRQLLGTPVDSTS
jgi:poly(3-hydroxyalkanoate) synthetase